jgi:hypothetical protein
LCLKNSFVLTKPNCPNHHELDKQTFSLSLFSFKQPPELDKPIINRRRQSRLNPSQLRTFFESRKEKSQPRNKCAESSTTTLQKAHNEQEPPTMTPLLHKFALDGILSRKSNQQKAAIFEGTEDNHKNLATFTKLC